MIGKIIFKYWIINVLIIITLFLLYRHVISDTKSEAKGFLAGLLEFVEIFAKLGFLFVFVVGLLVCSITFFLNLIEKIRNNFYLSLLSFIGIPLAYLIYFVIDSAALFQLNSVMTTFVAFSTIYLMMTSIQFFMFRKRITTLNLIE